MKKLIMGMLAIATFVFAASAQENRKMKPQKHGHEKGMMKNFLFAFAFIVALTGAFAFNVPEGTGNKFTEYHYTSTSTNFNVMRDPANWLGSGSSGCNSSVGTIPCVIEYTGNDLGAYLDDLGSSAAIVDEAETKRTP